ncbi:MAG TPA: GAF domain-containing protein [Candidatus Angelobacter sp.]
MERAASPAVPSDLLRRYQTLLEVGEVIHAYRDLNELFHSLAEILRQVIVFDGVGVGLVDERRESLRPVLVETRAPLPVELAPSVPVNAIPAGWVVEHQRYMRYHVDEDASKYPFHRDMLLRAGTKVSYSLPLSTSMTQLGVILFAFKQDVHLEDAELEFMQLVADQVAVAIENALNFQKAQTAKSELERRNEQQSLLLKLTNYLVSNLEFKELLQAVATGVRRAVPCAGVAVVLPNAERTLLKVEALDFPDSCGYFTKDFTIPMAGSMTGKAFAAIEPLLLNKVEDKDYMPPVLAMIKGEGFKSHCFIPFSSRGQTLGVLTLASREENTFVASDVEFLKHVAAQVTLAFENSLNYERVRAAEQERERERDRLQVLMNLTNQLVSNIELTELLREVATSVRRIVPCACLVVLLPNADRTRLVLRAVDFPDRRGFLKDDFSVPVDGSMGGKAFRTATTIVKNDVYPENYHPEVYRIISGEGFHAQCMVPLLSHGRALGTLALARRDESPFLPDDVQFLNHIAGQVALAVENSLSFEAVREAEQQEKRERDRLQLLMELTNHLVSNLDLQQLLQAVTTSTRKVMQCACVAVLLPEADGAHLRVHKLDFPEGRGLYVEGYRIPTDGSFSGKAFKTATTMIVNELDPGNYRPEVYQMIVDEGFQAQGFVPLLHRGRALGVMALGRRETDPFGPEETDFLAHIAGQIAIAVENSLSYEAVRAAEQERASERDQLQLLMDLNNNLASNLQLGELLQATVASVRRLMQCDIVTIHLPNPEGTALQTTAVDFPDGRWVLDEVNTVLEGTLHAEVFKTATPLSMARIDPSRFPREAEFLANMGIMGGCIVPMIHRGRVLGNLGLGRCEEKEFTQEEIEFLSQFGAQVAIAIENALAYREIGELKEKLSQEKLYLEDEIRSEINFKEIVGESASLKAALDKIATVAASDATVLILGETGTGKELVARAIHDASKRKGRTFVKLNCAAIPTGLLESELFGHEKGAFTGAIAQKIGRMELANGGTLFLDEVGDIPLELQPKLLRALQEREFERLGSVRTQKSDVRILAATNRDLQEMVADKEFRSDLYYRLNVFPIAIPALRDRHGDIPRLIRYFVSKYAKKMDKRIETVPSAAMQKLQAWHWPGNVRELENFIERSVILTQGATLHVPLAELQAQDTDGEAAPASLRDTEREHILKILKETRGTLAGPNGAAARLGVKRTTLQYKMKKLGITRDSY